MRLMSRRAFAACVLSLAACAQAGADNTRAAESARPQAPHSQAATSWLSDVQAIADADAAEGRRAAIQQRLDAIGVEWRADPFEAKPHRGTNLLAEVAGDADDPLLLLGAHWDQVSKGDGATDNASGSAVVLALARRLKERPLAHHRLAVAFWDLEEKGLLGAKAYVANGGAQPALYVNFDVFGWGNTLWMMTPDADGPLARASAATTAANGLKLSAGERYPPTDHLAFLTAGWPAVSYSLVGDDEIAPILDAYDGKKLPTQPRLMRVIHTDSDTLAQIDADAATRALDAVEAALRRWDAESAHAEPAHVESANAEPAEAAAPRRSGT